MTDTDAFPLLPKGLPSGRHIKGRQSRDDRALLWVSRQRQPQGHRLWTRLYHGRAESGLYPLLLETSGSRIGTEDDDNPWYRGEMDFTPADRIDALDADVVLQGRWPAADIDSRVEPEFPPRWPGLASRGIGGTDIDSTAADLARLLAETADRYIGLVPANCGADALTLCGWTGAAKHTRHTEELSVVVRSWEHRFGVRVVMVGSDTLCMSVAAPPTTLDHALRVAAEHLSFCPNNFRLDSFEDYAAALIGGDAWEFWWD